MAEEAASIESDLILRGNQIPAGILRSALTSGRIANAYLFKGPKGSPKEALALEFARGLLCDSDKPCRTGASCGNCWSCRAVSNHAHPDLIEIEREGTTIKIKKSHEMLREAISKPYHSSRKVFLIKDAEDLTAEASNALLKILEEPPAYVTFILTAMNLPAIPETIISRCQIVPFRKMPAEVVESILVARGVPVQAAAEAASHADGDLVRAEKIVQRAGGDSQDGSGLLAEIAHDSPVELGLKYSKMEPARRVDVLTDLEIELTEKMRDRVAGLDVGAAPPGQTERELVRLYRALGSLQRAKERLISNTNAFLSLSVLFMDLARILGD